MMTVRTLHSQLDPMRQIIGQLKKDKDSAAKKVKALEDNIANLVRRIQSKPVSAKEIESEHSAIMKEINKVLGDLQKQVEKQKVLAIY